MFMLRSADTDMETDAVSSAAAPEAAVEPEVRPGITSLEDLPGEQELESGAAAAGIEIEALPGEGDSEAAESETGVVDDAGDDETPEGSAAPNEVGDGR